MVLAFGNLLNGKQLGVHALRSLANLPVEQQLIKIEEFCAERNDCMVRIFLRGL